MDRNLEIAFSEAKYVLKHLPKEKILLIPESLRRFIGSNCDKEYEVDINRLTKRTYAFLAVINRKYLAENKEELEKEFKEKLAKEKEAMQLRRNSNQQRK